MTNNINFVPGRAVKENLITETDDIVYMPLATKETPGVVKIGEGINVENGVISFDKSEVTIKHIAKNGVDIEPDDEKRVNIELDKTDVGLNEVDNTSDEDKPVSRATRVELNKKLNKNLGSENVNKILMVNQNGEIVPTDSPIDVPTKTSQLENDGDGNSRFVTENDLSPIREDLSGLEEDVQGIKDIIPAQATVDNKLADKDFVNSTVQTNTANFRGNWTDWSSVPTDIEDYPEDYAGNHKPTVNDYMVVQNASDYEEETLVGTWRFKYTGNWDEVGITGWRPEYQVNETPLTSDQLKALNSGITSGLVGQITTNQNNIETLTSGLQETDNKVTTLENDVDELKVLKLYADPTTETEGKVGQFALNVTSSALFQCVSVDEEGGVYTYTWQAVGGGADEDLRNNTVQIVPTSGGLKLGGAISSTGNKSIAIGNDITLTGDGTVKIGYARDTNPISATYATIIGPAATGNSNGVVAIGSSAKALSDSSIAIGFDCYAQATDAIQLGHGGNSTNKTLQVWDDNIYNGNTHTATFRNLSDGTTTKTMTEVLAGGGGMEVLKGNGNPTFQTVGELGQIYVDETNHRVWQMAWNRDTDTYFWTNIGGGRSGPSGLNDYTAGLIPAGDTNKVSIGNSGATGNFATAIGGGSGTGASGAYSVALGADAKATGSHSIQLGAGTNNKAYTLQIGSKNIFDRSTGTLTVDNLSDGTTTKTMTDVLAGGGLPDNIKVNGTGTAVADKSNSIAIGNNARANSYTDIVIGYEANTNNENSIVIGKGANSSASSTDLNLNNITIGSNARTYSSNNGISLGNDAEVIGEDSIQLGVGKNNVAHTMQIGGYQSSHIGKPKQIINSLSIYQDAEHASDGVEGYKRVLLEGEGGSVAVDNTTISKNTEDELQAIGLTDGENGLTFEEIYQALSIERTV